MFRLGLKFDNAIFRVKLNNFNEMQQFRCIKVVKFKSYCLLQLFFHQIKVFKKFLKKTFISKL